MRKSAREYVRRYVRGKKSAAYSANGSRIELPPAPGPGERFEEPGKQFEDALESVHSLAWLLKKAGKPAEAESLYLEAIPLYRKEIERDRKAIAMNPNATTNEPFLLEIHKLGKLLIEVGRMEEAEPLYREELEGMRNLHGSAHKETLNTIYSLAKLLKKMGRVEEAIPLFREELEGCRKVYGATHEETLKSARNLAELLDENGRAEEAARLRNDYSV